MPGAECRDSKGSMGVPIGIHSIQQHRGGRRRRFREKGHDKRAQDAPSPSGEWGVAKSAPPKASDLPNPAKGTKGNLRGCWPIDGAAAALEREEVRSTVHGALRDGVTSGVRSSAVRSAAGSATKEERAAPPSGDCESIGPSQSPERGSLTLAAGWPMAGHCLQSGE